MSRPSKVSTRRPAVRCSRPSSLAGSMSRHRSPGWEIGARIYWPEREIPSLPAIAYFHGGGHVIGSLNSHDQIARNLCVGSHAVVVSVDYPMGPEHRFLTAVSVLMARDRKGPDLRLQVLIYTRYGLCPNRRNLYP